MYKPKKMGYCPKCNSDNVYYFYDGLDCGRDVIIHYAKCCNCDQNFEEYENTAYRGYQYEDEDGTHEFDAEGYEI